MKMQNEYDPDFFSFCFPKESKIDDDQITNIILNGTGEVWRSERNGPGDEIIYSGSQNEYQMMRYEPKEAVDMFIESRDGSITLFSGDIDFSISMSSEYDNPLSGWEEAIVVSVDRVHFDRSYDRQSYNCIEALMEILLYIFARIRIPFCISRVPIELEYETVISEEEIRMGKLPDIYWLMVFTPEIATELQLERIRSAPVWRFEEADEGAIAMIATEHPFDYDSDIKKSIKGHFNNYFI